MIRTPNCIDIINKDTVAVTVDLDLARILQRFVKAQHGETAELGRLSMGWAARHLFDAVTRTAPQDLAHTYMQDGEPIMDVVGKSPSEQAQEIRAHEVRFPGVVRGVGRLTLAVMAPDRLDGNQETLDFYEWLTAERTAERRELYFDITAPEEAA